MDNGFGTPRSARQLLGATFRLYGAYPWLFLVLAAGVIVPYEFIVLGATGSGPLGRDSEGIVVGFPLLVLGWVLITPLISALHVHAVDEVRRGETPKLGPTAREGLAALPLVVFVSAVSGAGIAVGLVLFVIPGLALVVRWYVVAQTAAIEHEGGLTALRRSADLTSGRHRHVIALFLAAAMLGSLPGVVFFLADGRDAATAIFVPSVLLVHIFGASISALVSALLYFDLRLRAEAEAEAEAMAGAARVVARPAQAAGAGPPGPPQWWDPRRYTDQDRPQGWYVDPNAPERMRYWRVGEEPGWLASTRTSRKVRREWRAEVGRAEDGGSGGEVSASRR